MKRYSKTTKTMSLNGLEHLPASTAYDTVTGSCWSANNSLRHMRNSLVLICFENIEKETKIEESYW